MKKVKLFEEFINEGFVNKSAKNILNALDKNGQLFPDYIQKEALTAIEDALKKSKGENIAKQIRLNLEDTGILANMLSPTDVESLIMNNLHESIVNEAKFKVGDSWEWNHVDGVKIVTITDVKSNGDVVAKTEGESQDFIVRDANKYLKKKVNESVVNEAKTSTREEIMDLMETKYKIKHVRTSEEFMRGDEGGIWIAGDNGEELSGNKIFDYYNGSAKYKNGVLKNVVDAVEKKGWWFSWNDPGTMMMWPKN
jgi:hypothetical protein